MRWLFVGIVALNLLYLGWRLASPDDSQVLQAVAPEEQHFPATLSLLSEAGTPAGGSVPVSPAVTGCPAIGPWANEAEAKETVRSLVSGGFPAAVRSVEMRGATVYWVYMPPFAGRQQALRKLRELHAKGIDSFVVSEGSDANAISLGSFTSRDSAIGVQSRLRAAGYASEIREQIRDVQQTWVVLQSATAQGYMEYVPAAYQERVRQERQGCH